MIKPGRRFELLATNTLDDGCMASPAVSGKSLFLRTKKMCIGSNRKGRNETTAGGHASLGRNRPPRKPACNTLATHHPLKVWLDENGC